MFINKSIKEGFASLAFQWKSSQVSVGVEVCLRCLSSVLETEHFILTPIKE